MHLSQIGWAQAIEKIIVSYGEVRYNMQVGLEWLYLKATRAFKVEGGDFSCLELRQHEDTDLTLLLQQGEFPLSHRLHPS
jgi:hypothetical protein